MFKLRGRPPPPLWHNPKYPFAHNLNSSHILILLITSTACQQSIKKVHGEGKLVHHRVGRSWPMTGCGQKLLELADGGQRRSIFFGHF